VPVAIAVAINIFASLVLKPSTFWNEERFLCVTGLARGIPCARQTGVQKDGLLPPLLHLRTKTRAFKTDALESRVKRNEYLCPIFIIFKKEVIWSGCPK
jgi:hypothetical protein